MQDNLNLFVLALTGVVAGFLNVTAGGGSLLALPMLMFLGLSPAVANGTNRLALLVQNIIATAQFHKFDVIPKKTTAITAIPAIVGSILGAQLAVSINEVLFKRLLALVIFLITGLILFQSKITKSKEMRPLSTGKKLLLVLAFFAIGFYGGFIQGGIGFLFIAILTLVGFDLVQTNALKVLVILIFTPFALAVFIFNGQIDYFKGAVLASGNAVGALVAARVVVEKGEKFVRWIVIAAALVFAVKLLLES